MMRFTAREFTADGRRPQDEDMRKDMMEILACPVDKSPLELTVEKEEGDEVVTGSLRCTKCGEVYPIEDTIPNLLPPDLRRAMEANKS